mmetsp:Transcript_1269/g.2967  ORF Transcript_1269/g.2967 Transcript_1269/m.2967 type:complete len:243 (+) Transcript_1269:788-1516(+)
MTASAVVELLERHAVPCRLLHHRAPLGFPRHLGDGVPPPCCPASAACLDEAQTVGRRMQASMPPPQRPAHHLAHRCNDYHYPFEPTPPTQPPQLAVAIRRRLCAETRRQHPIPRGLQAHPPYAPLQPQSCSRPTLTTMARWCRCSEGPTYPARPHPSMARGFACGMPGEAPDSSTPVLGRLSWHCSVGIHAPSCSRRCCHRGHAAGLRQLEVHEGGPSSDRYTSKYSHCGQQRRCQEIYKRS